MLSYKFKHLCSRVIASLSAVGLFSIANTGQAHAVTYEPGESVTNRYLNATTMTAKYSNTITCQTSEDDNRIYAGFAGTNAAGRQVCTYILTPGYALVVKAGNCVPVSGNGVEYYSGEAGSSVCTGTDYSGVLQDNYSGTTVAALQTPSVDHMKGHLYTEVQNAYNNDKSISTNAVVTVPRSDDGTAPLPDAVAPKEVRIDFDCGAGTYVSDYTGVAYVLYGKSFKLPEARACTPAAGKAFTNWSDGQ